MSILWQCSTPKFIGFEAPTRSSVYLSGRPNRPRCKWLFLLFIKLLSGFLTNSKSFSPLAAFTQFPGRPTTHKYAAQTNRDIDLDNQDTVAITGPTAMRVQRTDRTYRCSQPHHPWTSTSRRSTSKRNWPSPCRRNRRSPSRRPRRIASTSRRHRTRTLPPTTTARSRPACHLDHLRWPPKISCRPPTRPICMRAAAWTAARARTRATICCRSRISSVRAAATTTASSSKTTMCQLLNLNQCLRALRPSTHRASRVRVRVAAKRAARSR